LLTQENIFSFAAVSANHGHVDILSLSRANITCWDVIATSTSVAASSF